MYRSKRNAFYQKHRPVSVRVPVPVPVVPYSKISDITMPSWIEEGTASDIAKAAYAVVAPYQIGSYRLVKDTPTMKFYKAGKQVIIAIRGTKDARDVASWPLVATNSVSTGARFHADAEILKDFKDDNAIEDLQYYAVGHSLAGAIIDVLLRSGEVIAGISFNPAIQISDLHANLANKRIYHYDDPLYALMGRLATGETVVVGKSQWWEKIASIVPFYGKLYAIYSKLQAHKLSSF
jgi:hypothetical protein